MGAGSLVAIGGQWSGDPTMYIYSDILIELVTFDVATSSVLYAPSLDFINNSASSIAVSQGGELTMIADDTGYLVNTTTGAGTEIFTENGGDAPGQFSGQRIFAVDP